MTEARKEKGITLVALVVTIIILIILATISINAISGENSLIKKVQKEKEDYAESSKREDEKLGSMAEEYKHLTTPREPMEKPIPEGAISFGDISWENGLAKIQVVKNTEEYQLQYQVVKKGKSIVDSDWKTVEDKKANTVEVKELDLGDQVIARLWDGNKGGKNVTSLEVKDGEKPKVNITGADSTTNSITITITATDDESGMGSNPKYKYYIKQKDGQYGEVQEDTKLTHTFTGLNQTKEYIVKVEVEDRAGNLQTKEREGTITTKTIPSAGDGIQTGAITFKDAKWANKKQSVNITKTDTNYQLQYQIVKAGKELNNNSWTTETSKATNTKSVTDLSLGDQVVARLWDGTQGGNTATFTVKDEKVPNAATINLNGKTSIKKGDTINATVTQSDSESGINIEKCKWILHTQQGALGTADNSYTTSGYTYGTFTSESQNLTPTISKAGTYYLHVLSVDNAGNRKETVSGAITVEKVFDEEEQSKITIGPATRTDDYGKVVKNASTHNNYSAGDIGTWRLFYQDANYTYIISDNDIYYGINRLYDLYTNGGYGNKTGADVSIIGQKLNPMFKNFTAQNKTAQMRAVGWLTDTTKWTKYVAEDALYAIGGPTVELFAASYNTGNFGKTITLTADEHGYRTNTSPGWLSSGQRNGIYRKYESSYATYLGSPYGLNGWIMIVDRDTNKGYLVGCDDDTMHSYRPIVVFETSTFDKKYELN